MTSKNYPYFTLKEKTFLLVLPIILLKETLSTKVTQEISPILIRTLVMLAKAASLWIKIKVKIAIARSVASYPSKRHMVHLKVFRTTAKKLIKVWFLNITPALPVTTWVASIQQISWMLRWVTLRKLLESFTQFLLNLKSAWFQKKNAY